MTQVILQRRSNGIDSDVSMEGVVLDLEGDVSDDDDFENEEEGPWF